MVPPSLFPNSGWFVSLPVTAKQERLTCLLLRGARRPANSEVANEWDYNYETALTNRRVGA